MQTDIAIYAITALIEFGASLLGVFLAFVLNRRIEARRERRKAEEGMLEKRGQAGGILGALKQEIAHNAQLLGQMRDELVTSASVIFYNVDLSTWNATSRQDLDSLEDFDLRRRLSHLYYEYNHLARKVDRQFEMHFSAYRALTGYSADRQNLIGSILLHAEQLLKESKEVLSITDSELRRLRSLSRRVNRD